MIKNLGYRKLSRTGSHRRSMFSNMASSLILNEKMKTTVCKAKEIRRVVDKVITCAKNNEHVRVRRVIRNKVAYNKIFDVIAPRYKNKNGSFIRILRIGTRCGDSAEMALVKLVE